VRCTNNGNPRKKSTVYEWKGGDLDTKEEIVKKGSNEDSPSQLFGDGRYDAASAVRKKLKKTES